MRLRMSVRPSLIAALMVVSLATLEAQAQNWGTIKGQVIWDGKNIPENPKANVDKDKQACLKNGDILVNKYVINKENKGVRWVLVFLADPNDATNAKFSPAVHPSLKTPPKTVEIDQPCCVFEPRVIGLQAGKQSLVVKNSAGIPHNFQITSIGEGPNTNPLIPAKGQASIVGFVPKLIPTPYSCSIHGWMKGFVGTFSHPYFTVTDKDGKFEIKNAPVGKFQLVVWHEETGFMLMKDKKIRGKVIEVKTSGTDVGKIKMTEPKDD